MTDPRFTLFAAAVGLFLLILLLRPGRGYLWRRLRTARAGERVRLEDALKHLFDVTYKGGVADLRSLAGALELRGDRTAAILARLQALELVRPAGRGYELTPEGRREALRVIRIHRLWERYLSEKTGLDPEAWHDEAELREHTTTRATTEELAASLGHPRYDPHGDPIPTASGDIPERRGVPITELEAGELAEIVHVEDEPPAVYSELVGAGLHPGMRVRVAELGPRHIRFEADAEEHRLAPIVAANLWVTRLPAGERMSGPFARLSSLAPGERGRIVGLAPALRGAERRRLLDLGLVPGTEVTAELRSPSGDPTAYRVRGAVLALRRQQTDRIRIEALDAPPTERRREAS